jgi:hypothetical protein
MFQMERGAEYSLRGRLARMRDAEVLSALTEARSNRDRAEEQVVRDEMERRGLDE